MLPPLPTYTPNVYRRSSKCVEEINITTMAHNCENCKFRAHYDNKPNSLLGKFWRWHINFCPGWKGYFTSQSEEKKAELRTKYDFRKY
jgi:hypothetical protein